MTDPSSPEQASPPGPGVPDAALRRWIGRLDQVAIWSGKLFAWLIIPMVGALVYEVFSRYAFDRPTMWAYDTTFMIYGAHFMLGAAYTLAKGAHIRTDFFYRMWSERVQATVDLVVYLVFFFPGVAFFFWMSADFAADSWRQGERITTSPWLPIVYPFKTVIPVAAVLLMIQGVSEVLKCIEAIKHGRWA